MHKIKEPISVHRLEAFTDGIIAIIATILIFDLKINPEHLATSDKVYSELMLMAPKFRAYFLSFVILVVTWMRHHYLFRNIKTIDTTVLFLNSLFLMFLCLVPFPTSLIGLHPTEKWALTTYGALGVICTLIFYAMRNYVESNPSLLKEGAIAEDQRLGIGSLFGPVCYFLGLLCSWVLPDFSIFLYALVPCFYLYQLLKR